MNANPGELVVRLRDGLQLKKGGIYRVECITPSNPNERFPYGYKLVGLRSRARLGGFYADGFRKLNDSNDDAELIERIKNCKPVKFLDSLEKRG